MRYGGVVALLTAGIGLGAGSLALAQEEKATGVVAVRQSAMQANAGHMGAIRAILAEYPELIDQVPSHAEAVVAIAEHTPAMFPEGSDQEPTRALPAIWENPQQFQQAADRATQLAQALLETSRGGDAQATLAAFAALGRDGCGGCHENFREKQD